MEQRSEHSTWYLESFRLVTTLLFTDVVDSTELVVRLGDRAWAMLLDGLLARFRGELETFGGRAIDATGDGMLAAFDSPSRAVAAASAFRDRARELSVDIRCGIHAGEVEVVKGACRGLAVHIGARVVAAAGPGTVLVTESVVSMVVQAGVLLDDRGVYRLKGVPQPHRLFAVRFGQASPRRARRHGRTAAAVHRRSDRHVPSTGKRERPDGREPSGRFRAGVAVRRPA